jgi:hypothetical protein
MIATYLKTGVDTISETFFISNIPQSTANIHHKPNIHITNKQLSQAFRGQYCNLVIHLPGADNKNNVTLEL